MTTTTSSNVLSLAIGQIRIQRLAKRAITPAELADWVESRFGWPAIHGTVHTDNGSEPSSWNLLPDGTMIHGFRDVSHGGVPVAVVDDADRYEATGHIPAARVTPDTDLDDGFDPEPVAAPPRPVDVPDWATPDTPAVSSVDIAREAELEAERAREAELAAEAETLAAAQDPSHPYPQITLEDLDDPTPFGSTLSPQQSTWTPAAHTPGPAPLPQTDPEPEPAPEPEPERSEAIPLSGPEDNGWVLATEPSPPETDETVPAGKALGGSGSDGTADSLTDHEDDDADFDDLVARFSPDTDTFESFESGDASQERRGLFGRRKNKPVETETVVDDTDETSTEPESDDDLSTDDVDADNSEPDERRKPRRFRPLLMVAALVLTVAAALPIVGNLTGAYYFVPVRSDSMTPEIAKGDLVIVRPIEAMDVAQQDVIVYEAPTPGSPRIIHRVVQINDSGDGRSAVTKGDNNAARDPWVVNLESTELWRSDITIPFAGHLLLLVENSNVRLVATGLALLSVLALVVSQRHRFTRRTRPGREPQAAGVD